ncbi:hypothetical protein KC343_g10442 [Hortaea werneckii]|uniref:Uncharacterized protein n=1 Tax=Hortaea werneckii TaxID=91943 RepID=A0A3M7D185_HORWE|nr:hypothetical protein KC323_g6230 [Hortaea werneckii]KAI6875359.1 hypothetical protein KC338_g843 [Hortaea werneckii]KAI7353774.1 hypothetical protein KC320_g3820 [Hortaea werneckii]KAI7564520.1 hypothetical protein KC317_g7000 [Hortaea werneckii]KAI7614577.1 hypothetical protein KC343_g10442 [Hortaea werneckii]
MLSQLVLTAAMAASTVHASPLALVARDGAEECDTTTSEGYEYITQVGYYSDSDCTQGLRTVCVYATSGTVDEGYDYYSCEDAHAPDDTPYYAKSRDATYSDMMLAFTQDQTCPPSGPGAVFSTLIDNDSCVAMNAGGDAVGLTVYPHGGTLTKRLAKKSPSCSGFNIKSQEPSYSPSVQVSNIIDCTNAADSPGCSIEISEQHTESMTTSYSVSAGGGIEGIFEVSTTFGQDFTESTSTSVTEGYSVAQGQKGYLSAYNTATLFRGTFTGCDSGDSEQEGEALVLKKHGLAYSVIYTGA